MKVRLALTPVAAVLVLTAAVYFLGFAWHPSGNAAATVLNGSGCTVFDGNVSVEAPADSTDVLAVGEPVGSWSLLAYDAAAVLHTGLGGYGAERYVKAQLPWSVRMRLSFDSESDLLAAYGTREDICMLARVVEQRRLALGEATAALDTP